MKTRVFALSAIFGVITLLFLIVAPTASARVVFDIGPKFNAKQFTDTIRKGVWENIKPVTSPASQSRPQAAPSAGPAPTPPPGPGKVTLYQSWSPNPDRGVVGPEQKFRLTWKIEPNARGEFPQKCKSHGVWGGNQFMDERGGERFSDLPALIERSVSETAEGEYIFGIHCNWGERGQYGDSSEIPMFLDKPVRAFVSADGGGKSGVPGVKNGGEGIDIPSGQPVRINFSAINSLAYRDGVADCRINGGSFSNRLLNQFQFFDNLVFREQGSEVINPAVNVTYTLSCSDYFSQGDTDQIAVRVSAAPPPEDICIGGECFPRPKEPRLDDGCNPACPAGQVCQAGSCGGPPPPPPPEEKQLTVVVSGSGRVTGPGIDCPGDCSENFSPNAGVSLTSLAANEWRFSGWNGSCSGTGSCSFSMDSNKFVGASFEPIPDLCPNLPGLQEEIPPGYLKDARGNCVQGWPSVDLKANGSDGPIIINEGSAATLTWSSANVTSCTATGDWNNPGSRNVSGSESTGPLSITRGYTLTCSGPRGSISDSVTVRVSGDPNPPPTVDLKINGSDGPVTVNYNESATLSWTSQNTDYCTPSAGSWSGRKDGSGSQSTGALTTNTSYSLTCYGPGGVGSDSVIANIRGVPPPPPPPPCPNPPCDGGGDGNGGGGVCTGPNCPVPGSTQCYDGKDNDNDGKIDADDPDCLTPFGQWNPNDNSESPFRIREIIPDFFNLNWFKLNLSNFFTSRALGSE